MSAGQDYPNRAMMEIDSALVDPNVNPPLVLRMRREADQLKQRLAKIEETLALLESQPQLAEVLNRLSQLSIRL